MKFKVTVNPNPFTSVLCVQVHADFAVNVVIRLTNSKATVIRTMACVLKKGDNKVSINNLQRYVAGRYYLEVKLLTGDVLESINLFKK